MIGVIVNVSTADLYGWLPRLVLGTVKEMRLNDDKADKVMLSAVIIGIFTFEDAIFTAKVYGCQE